MTHREANAYHVYHEWEERELGTSIGICLTKATDKRIDNLETVLYEVIDFDALESVFAPRDGRKDTAEQVCFTIDGNTVMVSNHDEFTQITVYPNETTPTGPPMPPT